MQARLPTAALATTMLLALASTGLANADNYFEAPASATHSLGPGGFTIEAWVKVRSIPGENPGIVVGRRFLGTNDSDLWGLYVCMTGCTAGYASFACRSGGVSRFAVVSLASINDQNWHHLAGTYDGSVARLYVDGVPQGAGISDPGVTVPVAGGNLYLGQNAPGRNDQFDGLIDEVRLWNVARTGAEIETNRHGEIPGHANLIGYWRLNGSGADLGSGTTTFTAHGNVSYQTGQSGFGTTGDIGTPPPPSVPGTSAWMIAALTGFLGIVGARFATQSLRKDPAPGFNP